ncbi:MAG: hypothetical protein AB8B81_05420 [Halioglobus sp.]
MDWLFARVILCVLGLFASLASADISVADPALQKCVNDIAKKHDWTQPDQFEQISCHNKKIENIDGLEKFTSLTKLSLYKNTITALDLPRFDRLSHLNIAGNALTQLVVKDCDSLKVLYAFHNKLQRITIQGCSKLTQVKANNNALRSADLTELPALKKLHLFDNELEELHIESLNLLRYLDVRQNPMPDEFYDYLDSVNDLTSLHDGNADDWE